MTSLSRVERPRLLSHDWRTLSYDRVLTGTGLGDAPGGMRDTNVYWLDRARGTSRDISTIPSAQINRIYEVCECDIVCHYGPQDGPLATRQKFHNYWDVSLVMNASIQPTSPAGECLQGIEIGSFMVRPPFQTNYVSALYGGVIQFRYNYTLVRWEVCLWNGDQTVGNVPEITACDINPAWICDINIKEVRMVYDPNNGSPWLSCFLNGELIHRMQSAMLTAVYSDGDGQGALGFGYFACNGSNSASMISEASFHTARIYNPYVYPVPRNPL